jgi:hypothetical protein
MMESKMMEERVVEFSFGKKQYHDWDRPECLIGRDSGTTRTTLNLGRTTIRRFIGRIEITYQEHGSCDTSTILPGESGGFWVFVIAPQRFGWDMVLGFLVTSTILHFPFTMYISRYR